MEEDNEREKKLKKLKERIEKSKEKNKVFAKKLASYHKIDIRLLNKPFTL